MRLDLPSLFAGAAALVLAAGCGSDTAAPADTATAMDTPAPDDLTAPEDVTPDDVTPDATASDTDDPSPDVAPDTEPGDAADPDTTDGAVLIVASEGGVLPLPDGLGRLIVPPGALAADTTLTVALAPSTSPRSIGPSIIFGPSGTTFDPPATLELTPDDAGWDASLEAFGLAPALVIDQGDSYESVLGLGEDENGVEIFLVSHFSTFERTAAPSWGWQTSLAFPKSCYDLWSETPAGGTPPAGANQALSGSCPQARALVRTSVPDAQKWPPTGLGGVNVIFMGVLEWPDVTGGRMSVVHDGEARGSLNPTGQVALKWDIHVRFHSETREPSWCNGALVKSVIEDAIARAGGETERMLYTGVTATCSSPPSTQSTNGVTTSYYGVCRCEVGFGGFPWPDEPIPYTVEGTQLDLFGERFDFSVAADASQWWMNMPVIATVDIVAPLPETSDYAFAKMKLLVTR